MIATLCWKEYREQRGIWLAIVGFAVVLTLAIGSVARQGLWRANEDADISNVLQALMASLVLGHGIACGALLLASEKQAGTQAYLDTLPAMRTPMCGTKLITGLVLTVTVSQIIAVFTAYFTVAIGPVALVFVYYGLFSILGMFCGMLGGAVCQSVFPATVVGVICMIAVLLVAMMLPFEQQLTMLAGSSALACLLSWQFYCKPEKPRDVVVPRWWRKTTELYFITRAALLHQVAFPGWRKLATVRVCWWISWRQGRWIILTGLAAGLVAGYLVGQTFVTVFLLASVVIGLICGLSAFAPEQPGEQERFLGAQRVPPGRLWLYKTSFWIVAALLMYGSFFLPIAFRILAKEFPESTGILLAYFQRGPVTAAGLWSVHGFSFGLLFGLLARRIIVAIALAAFTCSAVLLIWLPSMLFGNLNSWNIVAVPLLLLVVTRLSMWNWFCGRLFTSRHIFLLTGCGLATLAWIAGNLWHRAVEIPDSGVPFDVLAYQTELNLASSSNAGTVIRQAAAQQAAQLRNVTTNFGTPARPTFPAANGQSSGPVKLHNDYLSLCGEIIDKGWPKEEADVGRWLDAMFAGEWANRIRLGARLPLGLITDLRQYVWHSPNTQDINNIQTCARLFTARALQVQNRGDHQLALEHLAVALALSRQVCNHAPDASYMAGTQMGTMALLGFDRWLVAAGPEAARIRQGLELLRCHDVEFPSALSSFKANYLFVRHNLDIYPSNAESPVESRIYKEAADLPWEHERNLRILNAAFQGRLANAQAPGGYQPHLRDLTRQTGNNHWASSVALSGGLPLADGPTTRLSPRQWGEILADWPNWRLMHWRSFDAAARHLFWLQARELVAALALYEAEMQKPASRLEDLVPAYLPSIPVDPVKLRPFMYKISAGEEVKGLFTSEHEIQKKQLLPGQGVLWAGRDSRYGAVGQEPYDQDKVIFPVPRWYRK